MKYKKWLVRFAPTSIVALTLAATFLSVSAVRSAHAQSSGGTICGSNSCFGGYQYICSNQGCGTCSVGNASWCAAASVGGGHTSEPGDPGDE